MKRFFFTLSVLLVALMILVAGVAAALHFGGIWAESKSFVFVGGWGVTQIPFTGKSIIFPNGDLHVIQKTTAANVAPGDAILFAGGSSRLVKSGCVEAVTAEVVRITLSDGTTLDEPAQAVFGKYTFRLPRFAWLLEQAQSPLAVGVFTLLLLVCIILWRKLPGRDGPDGALSESDEDIATILY